MDPLTSTPPPRPPSDLTDDELDIAIRARLELLGVDLSVLPLDDRTAPADQLRILASARRFLRTTPQAIADFALDPHEGAPLLYPAASPEVGERGR